MYAIRVIARGGLEVYLADRDKCKEFWTPDIHRAYLYHKESAARNKARRFKFNQPQVVVYPQGETK